MVLLSSFADISVVSVAEFVFFCGVIFNSLDLNVLQEHVVFSKSFDLHLGHSSNLSLFLTNLISFVWKQLYKIVL